MTTRSVTALLALLALIAAGSVTYFLSGQLLGAFRLSELKSAVKRGQAD